MFESILSKCFGFENGGIENCFNTVKSFGKYRLTSAEDQVYNIYSVYNSSVVKCSLPALRVTILDRNDLSNLLNNKLEKHSQSLNIYAPTRFPLTLEATGILEFAPVGVDRPEAVACAVLFTGMPVLPATGIDDRGFPNMFLHL